MKTFGLNPVMEGFSNDYRANIDPRITNEFAGLLGSGWSKMPCVRF